jgi:hypothetical protein
VNQRDYKRGLLRLKHYAAGTDWYEDFLLLENIFQEILDDILPDDENTRRRKYDVIRKLNALALKHITVSFNDLCQEHSPLPEQPDGKGSGSAAPSPVVSDIKKRWAVLVGATRYEDKQHYKRLPVCTNDVQAVQQHLVVGGFQPEHISLLADGRSALPTRSRILYTLTSVAKQTAADDLLLFYYTGHGDEYQGQSYLVANDGMKEALAYTAVSVAEIQTILHTAPARRKIILLDACHVGISDLSKGAQRFSEAFIKHVFDEAHGTVILTSCTRDQESWVRQERDYSVFTYYLVQALNGEADCDQKGFVTVADIHRYVSDKVRMAASWDHHLQTPGMEAKMVGEMICVDFRQRS